MDGLKLEKWKENFNTGMAALQIEFDAFFPQRKMGEFYILKVDEVSENLLLEILHHDELPKEIADRITEVFFNAKPEDSI